MVGFGRAIFLVGFVDSACLVAKGVRLGWSLVGFRVGNLRLVSLVWGCFNLSKCLLLGVSTVSVQISNLVLLGCWFSALGWLGGVCWGCGVTWVLEFFAC